MNSGGRLANAFTVVVVFHALDHLVPVAEAEVAPKIAAIGTLQVIGLDADA